MMAIVYSRTEGLNEQERFYNQNKKSSLKQKGKGNKPNDSVALSEDKVKNF